MTKPIRVRSGRARLRLAAGAGAAALVLVVGESGARAAGLNGYVISTAADAVAWVPVLPGFVPGADSPGEISLSDTAASLASGGVAYGRGALNYPGSFGAHLGPLMQEEGAPASAAQAIPPWPTLAEAGGGSGTVTNDQVPGATIKAFGSPDKSSGDSQLPGISFPGMLQVGSISTHSVSSTDNGTARASSSTVLHDVSVAGGAVTITSVTSSSAVAGSQSSGSVQVAGLRIAGIPATIDAKGVHAAGTALPGSDLNQQLLQSLQSAGLKLSMAEPTTSHTAAGVARQAGGLIIGIDTPESPAASAGVILVELGATAASVATSAGALQSVNGVSGPGGGTAPSPGSVSGGGSGSSLPAALTGGLSAGPMDTGTGTAGVTSTPASAGPGGVVGALNTLGSAAAYTYGGIPIGVIVISLLGLVGGSWALSGWVRRLAAWRGEA
ncbi:MAG TPA: choice-of-anchor P family protein [Acidimicrobiales bacterium]|nr:choice-of-anchor P family protein [Acidimicrobiales bacterium]